MWTTPGPSPGPRADVEFMPLLFSLQTLDQATPRGPTPARTIESASFSISRRSTTPPGSAHGEATPPAAPPPIQRLADDIVMEDGSATRGGRGGTPQQQQQQQQQQMQSYNQQAAAASYDATLAHSVAGYEDVWVTIFGFQEEDLSDILAAFSLAGDIVQWGTYGSPQPCNFVHLHFATKYGAQRALLRNGESLRNDLIIGVQPLQPRHRRQIDQVGSGQPGEALVQVSQPKLSIDRPYRVDVSAGGGGRGLIGGLLPQQTRSAFTKFHEFVWGI